MQWDIALAGLIVGCIIGLTGMGGGALMTPVLVIIFHVTPSAAISSDVVASFFLKPVGGGVHVRHGTVNWTLVRWLSLGSVPRAFAGAYFIDQIASNGFEDDIKQILGVVLLIAAAAMLVKVVVTARRGGAPTEMMDQTPRAAGPDDPHRRDRRLPRRHDVGRQRLADDRHADAALPDALVTRDGRYRPRAGDPARGCGRASVTCSSGTSCSASPRSVLVGAIPGVYVGARISARASDKYIRPLLVAVLSISALKLLNVPNDVLLGWSVDRARSCCSVSWSGRSCSPRRRWLSRPCSRRSDIAARRARGRAR